MKSNHKLKFLRKLTKKSIRSCLPTNVTIPLYRFPDTTFLSYTLVIFNSLK